MSIKDTDFYIQRVARDDIGKAVPPFDAIPSFISAGIILSYLGYYEEVKPLMLLLSYRS